VKQTLTADSHLVLHLGVLMRKTFLAKAGKKNRHHIKAKCRGGDRSAKNMILLDENKHAAFHLIFGTRTFREAAALLLRAAELKEAQ